MNLMYVTSCKLLWWLYDDDTACQLLSILQKFSNVSEIKSVPVSETVLLDIPYSKKIILHIFIMLYELKPSTCFMFGNLLW